jgi:hypothetical protein
VQVMSCVQLSRKPGRCSEKYIIAESPHSTSLSWLRSFGTLDQIVEAGFSLHVAGKVMILSAHSFRTKFMFDYAPTIFNLSSELLIVVCVLDENEELRVSAQSHNATLEFLFEGETKVATPFGMLSDVRLLKYDKDREYWSSCAILSQEAGGEKQFNCKDKK